MYAVNIASLTFQLIAFSLIAGGLGLLVGFLSFNETHVNVSLKMIFAAILLVSVKRWTGTVLLIFVQLDMFFTEPRTRTTTGGVGSILFCVLVLALLMFVSRYRSLRQTSSVGFMQLLRNAWMNQSSTTSTGMTWPVIEQSQRASAKAIQLATASLLLSLFKLPFVCVLAYFVFAWIPRPMDAEAWLIESDGGSIFMWPGPTLLVLIVAVLILLSEFSWRQQTAAQASLYSRSAFLRIHNRDLSMIVRRRLKAMLKQRTSPSKERTKGTLET